MKIQTKISKLQMHENLHKNVIEHFIQIFMSFYELVTSKHLFFYLIS